MGKRRQLILSDVGSKELKKLALHSCSPKIRQRCNIILLNTCGLTNVQIQKELGWKPDESFESGIRKTVQWYLSNTDWTSNVTSGAYREWTAKQYGA